MIVWYSGNPWHGLWVLIVATSVNVSSLACVSPTDCAVLGVDPAVICSTAGVCQCGDRWVLQHNTCIKVVGLNSHCSSDEECGETDSYCSKLLNICQCRQGYLTLENSQNKPVSCQVTVAEDNSTFIDLTMVGILIILALMFIVICVVLQMFSRAQFGETQTIFNTPNARLMNVSMVKRMSFKRSASREGATSGGFVNKGVEETPIRTRSQIKRKGRVMQEEGEACEQV